MEKVKQIKMKDGATVLVVLDTDMDYDKATKEAIRAMTAHSKKFMKHSDEVERQKFVEELTKKMIDIIKYLKETSK